MKKVQDRTSQEIETNWNRTWKEILELPDGSIDKEQLKKELMDFSDLIERMSSLTYTLTGGRLSYATYPQSTILFVKEEVDEENRRQQQKDDLEDGQCSLCGHEFDEDEITERSEPDNTGHQS